MKKLIIALLLTLPMLSNAQSKLKSVGMKYLNDSTAVYDRIQHQIHQYAELGYLEYKSSALLQEQLRQHGFRIEQGVAGMPTAFVATYGEGSPVVGMLAEYDALAGMSQDTVPYRKTDPNVENGHACGHNLLGTAAVAGAIAVSKWLAQGHKGTVKLYGCPAEEGGSGKAYLVREHCFDGVDAVLAWHPGSSNYVSVSSGMANIHALFTYHGKASHASAAPSSGRSALDGVEAFDYMMNLMREHIPTTAQIHYIITNGGQAANVVPELAQVEYFFRATKRDVCQDVFQRALKAAEGAAMGTGTTMEYEILSGNYEKLYNLPLGQTVHQNLTLVGGVQYTERERQFAIDCLKASGKTKFNLEGASRVKPLAKEKPNSGSGSTDVGNISYVVPTVEFYCATFVPAGGGHSWQNVASGGTTIGTKGMMQAARVFYLTTLDLMTTPRIVADAKAELEKRVGKDFQFVPLMGDRQPPLDYRKKK